MELTRIIRPALVIEESSAARIVAELSDRDVSRGGRWNASSTIWQRYTGPWNGLADAGSRAGFTVESLCDEALAYGGLTFADCARADLPQPPLADPFHACAEACAKPSGEPRATSGRKVRDSAPTCCDAGGPDAIQGVSSRCRDRARGRDVGRRVRRVERR